jgi:UDP-2-acetamido-2,6-beta-L-arabino-hexul-4-ose reductase
VLDADRLLDLVRGVDAVVHCAGVNRGTDAELAEGNLALARALSTAVRRAGRPVRVVYANSVHAHGDTVYGAAKRAAAATLAAATPEFSDVLLPNLYGEHGRPHYNSFVATFCQEIAAGRVPAQVHDREIGLSHAQEAAGILLEEAAARGTRVVEPKAVRTSVAEVLRVLRDAEAVYRLGELPDVAEPLWARLFNTYRSHIFPARYPIGLTAHADARGVLVECVRTGSAGGQAFVSSTQPGAVRGEHVHLRKFERFVVVDGTVRIELRRLFTDDVVGFQVDGARPVAVDMPTMWAHNLTNVGDRPATVFFWSSELYRPDDADTFPVAVRRDAGALRQGAGA